MVSISLASVLDPGSGGDRTGTDGGPDAEGTGGAADDAGDAAGTPDSRLVTAPELLAGEGPDEDLEDVYLFPAERVLVLLDRHGGRLWQGEIVEETGYSKAKVSTLLSEMEGDGDVDRYWMDGKKVVTLPGLDPEPIE